jgi:hypothetical protein
MMPPRGARRPAPAPRRAGRNRLNCSPLGHDEEHGVTGAAPNKVELHPVIYISFR